MGRDVLKKFEGKDISLSSVKNLTGEYGIEQDFVRFLKKGFLANGLALKDRGENADYIIEAVIKNIQVVPLSYRRGINVAYAYEYCLQISSDLSLLDSKTKGKKVFRITERHIYFSADSPASTESKKRTAILKVFERIVERFIMELSIGI